MIEERGLSACVVSSLSLSISFVSLMSPLKVMRVAMLIPGDEPYDPAD